MGVSIFKCIIKKDKFPLTLVRHDSLWCKETNMPEAAVWVRKKGNRDGRGKEQNVSEEKE